MKNGRMMLFAALAAATIVVAVLMSIFATGAVAERPEIVLPQDLPDGLQPGWSFAGSDRSPTAGDVSADTLSALVLSLERPEEYYATVSVGLYWDGGSSETRREIWSTGGCELIRSYDGAGGAERNCIVTGEETYIWYGDETQYYVGATANFSTDDEAQIPTYEDLAAVPREDILLCRYEASGDIPCLYAETEDDMGQTERWWVSLSSGLLWKFEMWDGGKLVYSMQTLSLSTDAVDRGEFVLPDGNNVFAE